MSRTTSSLASEEEVAPIEDRLSHLHQVFQEHAPRIRRLVSRLAGPTVDADDLVQDVFMVAIKSPGFLTGPVPPGAWLSGVAVKVVAAARRKAAIRRWVGLDDVPERFHLHTPERQFSNVQMAARLYQILDTLSSRKREVFILFELEGLSGEEIARLVGCPLKTVWSRLIHARKEFQEGLARLRARDAGVFDV